MLNRGMTGLCFLSKATAAAAAEEKDSLGDDASFAPTTTTTETLPPTTPRRTLSMIDQIIDAAHSAITKWDPDSSTYASVTSLFYESRREAKHFLRCVADLQKAMHLMLPPTHSTKSISISNSDRLIHAQSLMQVAAKRLQKEFYQILSTNRANLDPESLSTRSSRLSRSSTSEFDDGDDDDDDADTMEGTTTDDEIQSQPPAADDDDDEKAVSSSSDSAMADLRSIAECMISAGYAKDCVRIYKSVRKSIVDEGIYRLGVEKSTRLHHKMDWDSLELKISTWLNAVKTAVNALFTGERILCDHVFAASDSIRESCFADISKEAAAILFGFPEIVAKSKRSPERAFRLLDMYSAISDLWPEIESIFSFDSTAGVRTQAFASLAALSEAIYEMLATFESSILKDSSKSPVPGGGVHPLTFRTMSYLSLIADYDGVLTDIVADWPPPPKKLQLPESYFECSDSGDDTPPWTTAVSTRLAWLVLVLVCKLDGKATHYKDVSVSYLFLANNLRHIVSNVRGSNLRHLLGGNWVAAQEEKIRRFASSYERLGWGHVVSSLPQNPTAPMSTDEAKECFRRFNTEFEEAYRKHISCVVPDDTLRDEIKAGITVKLAGVYRELYGAHKQTLGCRRNIKCLVRYTPEDVEKYLSDLFFSVGGIDDDWTSSTPSLSISSIPPWQSRPSLKEVAYSLH